MRSSHMCVVLESPSTAGDQMLSNAAPHSQTFSSVMDISISALGEDMLRSTNDVASVQQRFGAAEVLGLIQRFERKVECEIAAAASSSSYTLPSSSPSPSSSSASSAGSR
jgi:hypothetical protein